MGKVSSSDSIAMCLSNYAWPAQPVAGADPPPYSGQGCSYNPIRAEIPHLVEHVTEKGSVELRPPAGQSGVK